MERNGGKNMALSIKLANFFIRTWIKVSWQKCCFWMSLQLQITLHTLIYILVRCIPSQYLAIVLPVYVHLTWSCTTHSSYCLVITQKILGLSFVIYFIIQIYYHRFVSYNYCHWYVMYDNDAFYTKSNIVLYHYFPYTNEAGHW